MKKFNLLWLIFLPLIYIAIIGSTYTGNLTTGGNLLVGGTGPHAIGGSSVNYVRLNLIGNFTSGGASTVVRGIQTLGTITGTIGDTAEQTGVHLGNDIRTQGASETINLISQLRVSEPSITIGTGDTVTTSATLLIEGAATEATNNWAMIIDAGQSRFDETIFLVSVTDDAAENPICRASNGQLSRGSAGCNVSSRRYKQNIQDLQYGLKEILQLRPVSFERAMSSTPIIPDIPDIPVDPNIPIVSPIPPTPTFITQTRFGLIAEEVATILPEIIAYEPNEPTLIQTYDYRTMHAILIKAIQEQQEQITSMKTELLLLR